MLLKAVVMAAKTGSVGSIETRSHFNWSYFSSISSGGRNDDEDEDEDEEEEEEEDFDSPAPPLPPMCPLCRETCCACSAIWMSLRASITSNFFWTLASESRMNGSFAGTCW